MKPERRGMISLNVEGTTFDDLLGIVPIDISNLLSVDHEYKPYPEGVISAAQKCTKTTLQGSDAPNLIVQARAVLQRLSMVDHLLEEGAELDIVDIVTRHYPRGIMLQPKPVQTDSEAIYRHIERIGVAFKRHGAFTIEEVVEMVQGFEKEIQGLHLAEMLMHSDDFTIDSIMIGLSKMPLPERILRHRINTYMENELTKMVRRTPECTEEILHVETSSLPLEIGERVAACNDFYNKYGGGAFINRGILFYGSGSSGTTFYDSVSDNFVRTIPSFYEKHVK